MMYQKKKYLCLLLGLFCFFTFGLASSSENDIYHPYFKSANATSDQGRVYYIDFWASWCTPCRKSFPWMNEMKKRYRDYGLKIIAINIDKKSDNMKTFLSKINPDFLILHDPSGDLAQSYKIKGLPSSYIIDRNGQIRVAHVGFREKDIGKLESNIIRALAIEKR